MIAFAYLDALESPLVQEPRFPTQAPDDRRDWSEIDRQATLRGRLRALAPSLMVFANANAGRRNPRQAMREGVTAGVFDLTIASGTVGNRFVAWIEVKGWSKGLKAKYPSAGSLSRAQIAWGNRMYAGGHHVACFFDPDAAVAWLRTIAPGAFVDRVGRL